MDPKLIAQAEKKLSFLKVIEWNREDLPDDDDDDDDDEEEEEEEDWEEDEDTYSICICAGMAFRYTKTEKCNFLSNPCN